MVLDSGEADGSGFCESQTVMRMRALTTLLVGLLWAAVLLVSPAQVPADQATYIYDDLGRLSQVIDGQGNVATYIYDAVGNLLSIARNTGGVLMCRNAGVSLVLQ